MLPPPIDEALQRGATVLTGTQRAARTLSRAFAAKQRAAGLRGWQPPVILPWSAFTAGLWQQLLVHGHEQRLLLNRMQEHAIWQNVIREDEQTATLQSTSSLAELAQQAHTLLYRYRARQRLQQHPLNTDQQTFLRWTKAFERICGTEGYVTAGALELALEGQAEHLQLAPEYVLHGFDWLTPSQQSLLGHFDVTVSEPPYAEFRGIHVVLAAPDLEAEVLSVAAGVRQRLAEAPQARIAVIVPDLRTRHGLIERAFRNTLAPHLNDIASTTKAPYEFSLGRPLAEYAAIADAIDLLRWSAGPLPVERVFTLLASPFMAGSAEHLERAVFDAHELRRQALLEPSLTPDRLLSLVRRSRRGLPVLQRTLQVLHPSNLRDRTYTAWMAHFRKLLHHAGWPGDRTLDSEQFQLLEKWEALLDQMCSLDFTGGNVSLSTALDSLRHAAELTLFAPESHDAPVQVMGILESAGSTFAALYFVNASEAEWPAAANPHPLLPHTLQQAVGMPGADPAEDFQHALRIAQRIAHSAPEVTFSHAVNDGETPLRESALLRHLGPLQQMEAVGPTEAPMPIVMEEVIETPLPALPERVLSGGVGVLKLQAACSFRAFAEHRLFSESLRLSEAGLDPIARGNVVHRTLEFFWLEVRSQARLRNLRNEERDELLRACIGRAMDECATAFSDWSDAYLDVQKERLRQVLTRWLELEAERRVPFVVGGSETEFPEAQIGPLTLKLRIDRIDELEGGGFVLIDYKTGRPQPSDWLTDRPEEPQLPLYATLLPQDQVKAVAFATIRAGNEMEFRGFESAAGILPKSSRLPVSTLEEQIEQWRAVLVQLANDFALGVPTVAPKQYPQTCQYCGQRVLCRVQPELLMEIATAVEEENDG